MKLFDVCDNKLSLSHLANFRFVFFFQLSFSFFLLFFRLTFYVYRLVLA